jgi:hypothetical protein
MIFTFNPPLEHEEGKITVWKFVGKAEKAAEIRGILEEKNCSVELLTETETDEQKRIRAERHQCLLTSTNA